MGGGWVVGGEVRWSPEVESFAPVEPWSPWQHFAEGSDLLAREVHILVIVSSAASRVFLFLNFF